MGLRGFLQGFQLCVTTAFKTSGHGLQGSATNSPPVKVVKSTPGSLQQALDALEVDYAFLLRGDVFTKDVIETWLSYKRESEVDAIALRPHPYEFHLYFDV